MVSLTSLGNLHARDALSQTHALLNISLERLSTGVRINRADDDPAGVMVRDRYQAQMRGFDEAIRNIQTAQSMIQVAEQGLNQITNALQVMRALAVRAADDSLNDDDRGRIQEQIKWLLREVNERAARTEYNGRLLLNGDIADSHPERWGSTKIQTNSFLANGFKLINETAVVGSNATASKGISQGSYEVKLVFSAQTGVPLTPTTRTRLSGTIDSPSSIPNNTTFLNQIVTDRTGAAHVASFTFTQLGTSRNYTYAVSVSAGGVYGTTPQTFTGTMEFTNDGVLLAADGDTVTPFERQVILADGTMSGHTWSIDFTALRENQHDPAGPVANATSNGLVGAETTFYGITGNLDSTMNVSDSATSAAVQVIDRTGAAHSVTVTYTKTATDSGGSDWIYTINGVSGGVWTGANSGNENGTLHFDSAGVLDKINGAAPATFILVIGDGTLPGQLVTVDFTTLTHQVGATTVTVPGNNFTDGTPGNPTTSIQMADNLVSGGGPTTVGLTVIDRTGTQSTALLGPPDVQPTITFSQIDDTNTWNYTITAPLGSGFTGFGQNLQGQVKFDEAGNLVELDGTTTLNKLIKFSDGTAEGQAINVDFAQLNMARATSLIGSTTDGGAGTQVGEVNAVIYYDDSESANSQLIPVSTLLGVDLGSRTYSAGGISFTLNTASSLNVGLVGYVKAYAYISATVIDHSLQFQVGPDEGQVQTIGISKMDVQTLFRRTENFGGESEYTDLHLVNTLKAQDLIGQLDDALNFVAAENLKVGNFHNNLSRTLELQRNNNTSTTNAYSLLNDADMAREATDQSKRMILAQSGTAMVAQANTQGQFLLQLLR